MEIRNLKQKVEDYGQAFEEPPYKLSAVLAT